MDSDDLTLSTSICFMNLFLRLISLAVICFLSLRVSSQNDTAAIGRLLKTPLHYVVSKTATPPSIDGDLSDPVWKAAVWTEGFSDIEGDIHPGPAYTTRVKMLWDDRNLYIGAELEEPNIWAYLSHHDDIVFKDNDFEVFIDPNNNAKRYYEVEINAIQTIFDLFLPQPYRHGSGSVVTWDMPGLRKAVRIDGTLNNGKDKDRRWTVEYAVPIRSMNTFPDSTAVDVHPGSLWRINFSRVQWDMEWKDGKYIRKTDPVSHRLSPEHNWVWSPQGIINMHFPERWGYLQFVDQPTDAFVLPVAEILKNKLWEFYYRQHLYYRQHGIYAGTADALGMDPKTSLDKPGAAGTTLVIETTPHIYKAILRSVATGDSWSIDADGNIENWTHTQAGRDDWGRVAP